MSSENIYDFVSIFAAFDFSYDEFNVAYDNIVNRNTIVSEGTNQILYKHLETVATVEHEYFHSRHLNSSSIGYLLFSLRQRITLSKNSLLKSLPFPEFAIYLRDKNNLITFVKETDPKNECKYYLGEVLKDEIIWDSLQDFSKKNLTVLHSLQKTLRNQWTLVRSEERDNFYALLSNILSPDSSLFSLYKQSATLMEIVEGIALWKEYSYISRLLWHYHRDKFSDYAKKWLNSSSGQKRYRKAADLIYKATGCNMAMALPGVLMDIALSGPCWSLRTKDWSEVHPSLRLAKILSITDRIPKSLKAPDNIDMVGINYYLEVENFVCSHLDWSKKKTNLEETLESIRNRQSWSKKQNSSVANSIDLLTFFYEPRFIHGLIAEINYPSTQLSPWNHEHSELVGHYTKPAASIFTDRISASSLFDEPKVLLLGYLNDIVITLVVNAITNSDILPFTSRSIFKRARNIFGLRKSAFSKKEWEALNETNTVSFEDFISESLGFDYFEYQKILSSKLR